MQSFGGRLPGKSERRCHPCARISEGGSAAPSSDVETNVAATLSWRENSIRVICDGQRPPLLQKMIVRARVVVTMDGPPIENGAVRVRGERIVEAGRFLELASGPDEIIDLGDHILLPGLINAHCHLDYTCLRGKISPPQSFADWIRAINAEKAKLSAEDYVASIKQGFAEAKQFGTATIANLTAFPELIAKIDVPIRSWWFAELIDVRNRAQPMENLTALSSQVFHADEFVDAAIERLEASPHRGLAPHAPFTASAGLYRRCEETAQRENFLLTTHLAESRDEMEMFHEANGSLYDFLKDIGRDMKDCGGTTPLEVFFHDLHGPNRDASTSLGMTPLWIIAHLNELLETDFDLLAKISQKFSIVHCPRSHAYFGHSDFQFERLRELGFNICLGTDSLASNDDLSLFAEMRMFRDQFRVQPEKVLEMATINPACALKQGDQFGKIRRHFLADMIALPFTKRQDIFETILNFVGKVPWIMLHGKISP
jgi:cytosine/adenosine deaminase-related metal-dependent hydrolase